MIKLTTSPPRPTRTKINLGNATSITSGLVYSGGQPTHVSFRHLTGLLIYLFVSGLRSTSKSYLLATTEGYCFDTHMPIYELEASKLQRHRGGSHRRQTLFR